MATAGIDLTRLTLKDALDLATLIEEEALDRYEEFADQMDVHHNPPAAAFFRFMLENERRHGTELARKREALFGDAPRTVTRSMLFDVEAPEYDEARAFMTVRQAMHAALRCEVKAYEFFMSALPQITNPEVRRLFEELRGEEEEHRRLLQEQIDRLPPDPPGRPEDVADEPVAH